MAIAKKRDEEGMSADSLGPGDDLVIEQWSSVIDIDNENNGHILLSLEGRVKVGRLREKRISIFSDTPTSLEDMALTIKDLNTGEELIPKIIIDENKYKWITIPFKYPIEKDEEFGFEARYTQPKTYKAIGEDYYSYTSRNDIKELLIKIKFPRVVKILDTDGSSIRTSGGIILDLPKDNRPIITQDGEKPCIVWAIKHGKIGYTYTLRWRTEEATL